MISKQPYQVYHYIICEMTLSLPSRVPRLEVYASIINIHFCDMN